MVMDAILHTVFGHCLTFIGLLFLSLAAGCSEEEVRPPVAVFPVDGQLLFQNKPARGAVITFHSLAAVDKDGQKTWLATVKDDGHFVPKQADGAIGLPAGEYVLTAEWKLQPSGDQLNGKYASPENPLTRITVMESINFLPPINLK